MDDSHRRSAAGLRLAQQARCHARGCTLGNIVGQLSAPSLDGLARHAVPNLVGCVRNVTETNSSPGAAVSLQDYAAMALRASTVHRSGAALVAANASSAFMRKVVSHMNTRLRVCQLA